MVALSTAPRLLALAQASAAAGAPVARVAPRDVRLLVVDPATRRTQIAPFATLAARLAPGDLLVVNDAATLPASLTGEDAHGHPLEARLAGPPEGARARAVLLGRGDHRTRTEDRAAPPRLRPGDRLCFARAGVPGSLCATVGARSPISERLVELVFEREGAALWSALYALGRPVQYAHRREPLALWDVQTVYATRPWAAEMPSAGRPLTWDVLAPLAARGVRTVALTHAAGLSATGDPALDAALPWPERYEIPPVTATAIARTLGRGGRVVAVGTSVVRALEAAASDPDGPYGVLRSGAGVAELILDEGFRPRIVGGLVTGIHAPGESHYRLLAAFLDAGLREAMSAAAAAAGLATHELGDATLILRGALPGSGRL